jgi:hypothetical protein
VSSYYACRRDGCYESPGPYCIDMGCYTPAVETWYLHPSERSPGRDAFPFPFSYFYSDPYFVAP